jgi:hypothetical protein
MHAINRLKQANTLRRIAPRECDAFSNHKKLVSNPCRGARQQASLAAGSGGC